MSSDGVWIKFQGTFVFLLCASPIEIHLLDICHHDKCLGERVVYLQGLQCCPLLFLPDILWGQQAVPCQVPVNFPQLCIGGCVTRIFLDRLFQVLNTFLKSLFRHAMPVIAAHHVKLVSFATL